MYMRRAGLPWETIAKITGHKNTKNLIAYYDTYLEGQGMQVFVIYVACDQRVKSGFADVSTAIGTGAGFSLGDEQVKIVLENRKDLQRPIAREAGAGGEEIKVFL